MSRDYGFGQAAYDVEPPPTGPDVTTQDVLRWATDQFQKLGDALLSQQSGSLFVPLPAQPSNLPIGQGVLAYFAESAHAQGEGFYVYEQNAWKKLT